MEIKRSGSEPSAVGLGEYFTGPVRIDTRFTGTNGRSATMANEPIRNREVYCGAWKRQVLTGISA